MNEGQQTKQKSGSKGAVIVLLILLLASVGGNIWQYFNTREVQIVTEKMTMQMDTLTARKIELEKEFTTVSTELDQFRGRSAEMDSLLADADRRLYLAKNAGRDRIVWAG